MNPSPLSVGLIGCGYAAEIQRNDAAVAPDLDDGRRALQVALAAVRSADSGQVVRVTDAPRTVAAQPPT